MSEYQYLKSLREKRLKAVIGPDYKAVIIAFTTARIEKIREGK